MICQSSWRGECQIIAATRSSPMWMAINGAGGFDMNPRSQPTVEPAHAAHLDDLLDEALKGTFPASDPIAIGLSSQGDRPEVKRVRPGGPGPQDERSK
jgi:hypothetical protein